MFNGTSYGDNIPVVKEIDNKIIVVLPDIMKKALTQFDPSFSIWEYHNYPSYILEGINNRQLVNEDNAPFAVIADFNGDGILDVALHGRNDKNILLISIISIKDTFKVLKIDQFPIFREEQKQNAGDHFIQLIQKGNIKLPSHTDGNLSLKNDAIELIIIERAGIIYHFGDGKWHRHISGD